MRPAEEPVALNRLPAVLPSEQPWPSLNPQENFRSKAFAAYLRWVVGMT